MSGEVDVTNYVSAGCVGYQLDDGRRFEVDLNDDHHSPKVLTRAAEMAFERGGQNLPICDYDIRNAREEITGEVDEIARLRRELAEARAEIHMLTTQASGNAAAPLAPHQSPGGEG